MTHGIDRRRFVQGLVASAVLAGAGVSLRTVLAGAATPGDGPYGPLGEADAAGFHLPAGFRARLLATSGDVVAGTSFVWHGAPDGGGCLATGDGGWLYVSNAELGGGAGGASVLRFDGTGAVVDAYAVLSGTSRNCAGGLTRTGTWLSCEEIGSQGLVWECPTGAAGNGVARPALGAFNHEAVAEDPVGRAFYLTEDEPDGRLYRFVPEVAGDLARGELFAASVVDGLVQWVPTSAAVPDRQPVTTPFAGGEGIWIDGRSLWFTTKGDLRVWQLGLDTRQLSVVYDGRATPGAALDAVDNLTVHAPSGDVFVCEDGGNMEVCLLATDGVGTVVSPFLRIDGHGGSEWCGIAFSPDHMRMYLSSQRGDDGRGRTYEITGPFRTAPVSTTTVPPTSSPPTSSTSSTTTSTTTTVPAGPVPVTPVAFGTTWRYHDQGTDLGTTWRTPTYDDTTWRTGAAPLGYGDPVTTTIASGPTPTNRPITAYFRHTFTTTGNPITDLTLRIRRDDGAVIHLDGTELARTNMPTGTITATTRALSSINDAAETQLHTITIPTRTLTPGTHVLAVEIHQYQPSSSDLSFDLTLTGRQIPR